MRGAGLSTDRLLGLTVGVEWVVVCMERVSVLTDCWGGLGCGMHGAGLSADRQTVGVEWVVVRMERVSVLTDRLLGLTGLWYAWSGSQC